MSGPLRRAKGGTYPVRQGQPLSFEDMDLPRPSFGSRRVRLQVGSLAIEMEGLDDRREAELRDRFGRFASEPAASDIDALQVGVRMDPRPYFLEPPERPEFNPVFLAHSAGRVRYLGYKVAGWFDTLGGRGVLVLGSGGYEPDLRAIENYLVAAVAWQAARRGGALVHGASAVLGGRAYLFYGESGAGKSTLAASNRRARVISEDLSLVLPDGDGRPTLVSSPLHGNVDDGTGAPVPVAAGFRLVQAGEAAVRPVPRARALAELIGSLVFVAEAYASAPELWTSLERTFASVPLAHLHFRRDDEGYWDAILGARL